jgi:hypothetical protein
MAKASRTAKQMDRLKREITLLRRQLRQQAGDAAWKPTAATWCRSTHGVGLDHRRGCRPKRRDRGEGHRTGTKVDLDVEITSLSRARP